MKDLIKMLIKQTPINDVSVLNEDLIKTEQKQCLNKNWSFLFRKDIFNS